jgi:hypothetical protein
VQKISLFKIVIQPSWMTILNRSGFFVLNPGFAFNPDFAFKMSKNFFPLKTSILQPLQDAHFLGPSRLQD